MDIADLVAAAMTRRRIAALFVLGGLALFAVQRWSAPPERVPLVVRLPQGMADDARERTINDAVLVEVGLALDWQHDPLIRDRLTRTMAPLRRDGDVLAAALAIDLPRRDPLVRARLIERARRTLPLPGTPSDEVLAAFAREHAERFMQPLIVTFEHRMERPDIVLGPRPTRSLPALERVLGVAAAAEIAALPIDEWREINSSQGRHQIKVTARVEPKLPALSVIRAQVIDAWRAARAPALEREAMSRLRDGFEVIE